MIWEGSDVNTTDIDEGKGTVMKSVGAKGPVLCFTLIFRNEIYSETLGKAPEGRDTPFKSARERERERERERVREREESLLILRSSTLSWFIWVYLLWVLHFFVSLVVCKGCNTLSRRGTVFTSKMRNLKCKDYHRMGCFEYMYPFSRRLLSTRIPLNRNVYIYKIHRPWKSIFMYKKSNNILGCFVTGYVLYG